jgi:hypothetical protein
MDEPLPPARPGCGEKFCERCGDCLACYGGENCYGGGVDNGDHVWPLLPPEP